MFDPPDYPYKDLSDTLRGYSSEELLYNDDTTFIQHNNVDGQKTVDTNQFYQNDYGPRFNVDALSLEETNLNIADNAELLIIQSNNSNDELTLLDENTVNQFLLPLQDTAETNKEDNPVDITPDLLALHSCFLCDGIFTTEADLLDHTISLHVTDSGADQLPQETIPNNEVEKTCPTAEDTIGMDLETDWFVCCTCERVLSTALESEPNEQLCCFDVSGKSNIIKRKLLTMYVCEYCSGLFADGEALDRHIKSCSIYYVEDSTEQINHSTVEPVSPQCSDVLYSCDNCGQQSKSSEQLKMHLVLCQRTEPRRERRSCSNISSSKMWNCGSCNQLFVTARELYRHKRGEDRPPGAPLTAFVCEECDKVLGSMCALHTHRKMHKVTKPGFPCRICGRRFNQSGHLAIHMRMHTGERPYPCDLCSKAFKVKVERDDHRRTHTGERPFACTACPKTFTAAARLREHARIHTDQRPYRCEICGAAFRRPYARTVHTLIHTGEKPHECDICGTAFRRSGDMWKHKRTIHGSQVPSQDSRA